MPPIEYVIDAIFLKFLPAAGTAALIYSLVVFLFGSRLRMIAAWFAVAGSWGVANLSFNVGQEFLKWLPWAEGGKAIDWIPYVAMAAMTIGAISELTIPWFVRLILFGGLAGASAWFLTPELERQKHGWMVPALAGVAGLNAFASWGVARRHPGGLVAFAQSIALMSCSMVLIYAHTAKMMDICIAFGSSMFGIALLASQTKSDAGISTSAIGMLLPGIMLNGWDADGDIPLDSFLAATLAPAFMGLTLLLPAGRISSRLGWLVPLTVLAVPVGWALMRAIQNGSLAV